MRYSRLLAISAVTVAASSAVAQTGRGTLTGSINDAGGRPLQGAQVRLSPGSATATTDAQGQYLILGLAPGQYTVSVAYSGFNDFTQPVTVGADQPARSDIQMQIASATSSVDVYAGRQGGEVEAINRTFTADNIINVLPADVITSLPNANVADAIGRLPSVTLERDEGEGKYVKVRGTEPRLTHTTLDGVTIASPEANRQIKLDIIPADLVESVQINKTLQADMEGDGIGGSVDLRTKSAEDRPTIYLESTGGYNPILGGRPNYQFDGTLGRRFLTGKKLGALISGSYDWNGRGINDIEPGPALAGTYDLRNYRYFRDRWGLGGTLDYKLTDTSNVSLKALYSHFNNFGDDWIYSPTINSFSTTSPIGVSQGGDDGTVSFSALRRRPVQDIGGLQLNGRHVVRRALISWDIDSSVGRTRDLGYENSHFAPLADENPLNHVAYSLDVSNPLLPHINAQNGVNIFDPTKYFFQFRNSNNFYNPEVDLGAGGSIAVPYSFSGHAGTIEVGGRFRNEHKFENQNSRNFYAPGTTLSAKGRPVYTEASGNAMSNFLNDFSDPNYYGGSYQFGPAVDVERMRTFAGQQDLGVGNSLGNSFNQLEKIPAGYVMNTTNFGSRWRLVAGIRIEATLENNTGYLGASNSSRTGSAPIRIQTSYINPLPSASLRYAFNDTSGLRIVYGRGVARPQFSDLIPFQTPPSGGTARNTVSQGNPNLKAETADNIDLLYEKTLPHTGLLQSGFFYKHLANPIVPTQILQPANLGVSGNNLPYLLNQTINAGSAYVYGFEISFQQHFTYLPGLLNGLGALVNYGYTNSAAALPSYVDLQSAPVGTISGPDRGPEGAFPKLIGQAPNSYNVSPTYDKRNLSLRLGMTYNQDNISAYNYGTSNSGPITINGQGADNPLTGGGPLGPNGDQYFYSHLQLDLQGTYNLPKGFQAVGYALNLNNEVFGFYQGGPNFPVQREFYRQTFGGGLRWSPTRESK